MFPPSRQKNGRIRALMCPWCPQLSKVLSVWSTRFHVLTANSSTCLTKSVISKKKWVGSQVVCEKNTVSGELILFSPHLCWTVGSVYSLTVRSIYVVEHCSSYCFNATVNYSHKWHVCF